MLSRHEVVAFGPWAGGLNNEGEELTLRDALELMLQSVSGTAVCVDRDGCYQGAVRIELLTSFLEDMQRQERARQAAVGR